MSTTTKAKREKILSNIIQDTFWMARRYAHGRHTYAPGMVRDSYMLLKKHFPELVPQKDTAIEPPSKDLEVTNTLFRNDYLDDINEDIA